MTQGDGAQIYRKWVQPAIIDLRKVAAHYAIASVLEPSADLRGVYCYEVQREHYAVRERERTRLAIGRIRICSTITTECAPLTFVALHIDDHQTRVCVRETPEDTAYMAMVNELSETLLGATASEVVQRLDEPFGNDADSLHSLFKDEQRTMLELILASSCGRSGGRAHSTLHSKRRLDASPHGLTDSPAEDLSRIGRIRIELSTATGIPGRRAQSPAGGAADRTSQGGQRVSRPPNA